MLVKWWLLAIPQYVVLGVLHGRRLVARQRQRRVAAAGFGLIGLVMVFAGVALLFTGRYPRGMFDFVMGMNRWVYRVVAYAAADDRPLSAVHLRRRPDRARSASATDAAGCGRSRRRTAPPGGAG